MGVQPNVFSLPIARACRSLVRLGLARLVLSVAVSFSLSLACSGETATLTDCVADGGVVPICGFENPEDLARLPGGNWVAVSQVGGSAGAPGSLIAYRASDGRKLDLFPHGDDLEAASASRKPAWGEPDCPGPPDPETFSPYGIDIDIDAHRLAVVNHGAGERVELFEVGRSRRGPAIVWRGCVLLPAGDWLNDVALLDDGGFLATRMMAAPGLRQVLSVIRMLLDLDTGRVLEWRPGTGLRDVPNSAGNGPNGIATSGDGQEIFFTEWSGRRLVRLRRRADGSSQRTSIELPQLADNLTWTRTGRLLVTGQRGPIGRALACGDVSEGTCALPFSVFEVEPATLGKRRVLAHEGTAMGAGSVALELGSEILIGTFRGDRLARARFRLERPFAAERDAQPR